MKTPNPRCFGVWRAIGKKIEAEKPNRLSAKCAISPSPRWCMGAVAMLVF
jgi:hypothetical protein